MATIEKQTVTVPATQLRKYAATLRRIRARGVESWGNHYLLHTGRVFGGDVMETLAAVSVQQWDGQDADPIAIPHDTLTAALKGAKGDVMIGAGFVATNIGTFAWDHSAELADSMVRDHESIIATNTEPDHVFTMNGPEYRDAVSIAGLYVSKDATRPVLTGVCITREGDWYATDSYRLITMVPPNVATGGDDPIVPFVALDTAARLSTGDYPVCLREYVRDGNQYAHVDTGNGHRVWSRTHTGQYPDCAKLIPERGAYTLSLNDAAVDTLLRFCKAAGKGNTPVRLTFGNGSGHVIIEHGANGTTVPLDAPIIPEAMTIGMNAAFLADCLTSMPQGGAELNATSPLRPFTFRAADSSQDTYNVTAICMPMRV